MTRTKQITPPQKDTKKESYFKQLVQSLAAAGYTVRREKLRQGPGWKVVSGSCRANNQRLVFVDPRMPQDDQIMFLKARLEGLNLEVPSLAA